MNAYQKAQSLALTGTDSEIVGKLQCLTAGHIPVENVLQWFDEQNLGEMDPIANSWVGVLVDVVKSESAPAPIRAGLRKLFTHLAKRTSKTVDTTDLTIAVETFSLMTALIQMGIITAEQRDSFYALDGGRPYKDLSIDQFTAQREAAIAADAAQSIREAAWTVMDRFRNQIGSSEQADGIAAMRAMLDGLEAG